MSVLAHGFLGYDLSHGSLSAQEGINGGDDALFVQAAGAQALLAAALLHETIRQAEVEYWK
jgi:hypothetical protein